MFLGHYYLTYSTTGFAKRRSHYSASPGTSQIQFCRIKVPKTPMFMICRIIGHVTDPQKALLDFGSAQLFETMQEKLTISLGRYSSGILRISRIANFGKDACRSILFIRFMRSWKSWIWDPYVQKNMEWAFGTYQFNLRNLSSWNSFLFLIKGILHPSQFCFRGRKEILEIIDTIFSLQVVRGGARF